MRNHRSSAAVFAILWLGCGSEDRPALLGTLNTGSGSDSAARGQWCESLCDSARRCQVPNVPLGCGDNCSRANTNFFERTNAASLEYQSRCMDEAACPENFDDM